MSRAEKDRGAGGRSAEALRQNFFILTFIPSGRVIRIHINIYDGVYTRRRVKYHIFRP